MGSVVDQLTIADAIAGKWLLLLPVSSVAVQRRCPPAPLPRSPSSPIASSSTAVQPVQAQWRYHKAYMHYKKLKRGAIVSQCRWRGRVAIRELRKLKLSETDLICKYLHVNNISAKVLLTILTQLELGEVKYLCLLPEMNVTCTLNFHRTSPALLAAKDIVIAAVMKKSEIKDGQYVFDIPTIANSIGLQPADLSNHLQSLKFKGEITYELKDQAYCFTVMDIPKDICSLAAQLTNWLSEVERCKVRKMDAMFNAAVAAVKGCDKVHGCNDYDHTPCLQRKILEYFESNDDIDVPNKMAQCSPFLRADIKVFLQSNSHAKFTPRAVARILHGLSSPAFTSAFWSKCHFWGRYMQTDFDVVMEAAKAELMGFVGKDSL